MEARLVFQFQGIWLPDGEKHFPAWMAQNGELIDGKGSYQIRKWRACRPWITNWHTAVDVGSHVGLWTMHIAREFGFVHCFEPMEVFSRCAFENLKFMNNFAIYPVALGAERGEVAMDYRPEDSGNTHVVTGSTTQMRVLDDYDLVEVGFIKVDCEGTEVAVLAGARRTLERCRPCVIVEQKQHKMKQNYGTAGTPAVDLLRSMGAVLRQEIGGDYILSW